jgi:uncharacterized paraquat-inducible protein A
MTGACPHCRHRFSIYMKIIMRYLRCKRCHSLIEFQRRLPFQWIIAIWLVANGIPRFVGAEFDLEGGFWLLLATVMALLVWVPVIPGQVIQARGDYCKKCGYDLVSNTTGRCPECGQSTSKAARVTQQPTESNS